MPLPSPKELHMEMPLYEELNLGAYSAQDSHHVVFFGGTIDAFCPYCKKESVFQRNENAAPLDYMSWQYGITNPSTATTYFAWRFECTRNEQHRFTSYFVFRNATLMKIGQFPSVADFQIPEVEKYERLLGTERHRELVRAIGLAAHGVGIGSFVYLRRVFESLIEDAHQVALTTDGFNDVEYRSMRTEEKILALKSFLPDFLVENRAIYSILSTGIHALTERECLEHYEPMRVGIELILDQRLEQEKRRDKEVEAKKAIAKIHGAIKDHGAGR
jgi:hypothetical protein